MSTADTIKAGRGMTGPDMPPSLASLRHLARHQVMGLASMFLLGMAVNLTGLPAETSGAAHLASIAFLTAHALIALGLVIGTVMLLRAAAPLGGHWRRHAIAGATAIAVAVAAGILTLVTKNNWWSYTMAVGFIAALLAYGSLLLPATAPTQDSVPPFRAQGQQPTLGTPQTLNTSRRQRQPRLTSHQQITPGAQRRLHALLQSSA